MVMGKGYEQHFLSEAEMQQVFAEGLAQIEAAGKKILVIMPDSTRSGPFDMCFRMLAELLMPRAAKLDFMIALGTHMPMDEARICRHLDISAADRAGKYAQVGLLNHDWENDVIRIGTIPAAEISALTGGLMSQDVPVQINRRVFDYDHLIVCGPVFPHEVAGFSGGNKYFFPGVGGPEVINFTHWLGAVISNVATIGRQDTPVRRVIDRAAALIDVPKSCFSLVVKGHHDVAGLYFGTPEESQTAAAELSAKLHVTYVDKPFHTVISVMPELYDDVWTAGKGMYKVEPIVADGGKVIIYAPHIDEVSYTHGKILDRIGYHVRDYFLKQWDKFSDVPGGVMAHSTHVKGAGSYEHGMEKPRVEVILATGVPKERCQKINLGYMDPASLNLDAYRHREEEGILVIPRAGELLYRLRTN
jgi:nickel-dependent lactate racemase